MYQEKQETVEFISKIAGITGITIEFKTFTNNKIESQHCTCFLK